MYYKLKHQILVFYILKKAICNNIIKMYFCFVSVNWYKEDIFSFKISSKERVEIKNSWTSMFTEIIINLHVSKIRKDNFILFLIICLIIQAIYIITIPVCCVVCFLLLLLLFSNHSVLIILFMQLSFFWILLVLHFTGDSRICN